MAPQPKPRPSTDRRHATPPADPLPGQPDPYLDWRAKDMAARFTALMAAGGVFQPIPSPHCDLQIDDEAVFAVDRRIWQSVLFAAMRGYRGPCFSLTGMIAWAADHLPVSVDALFSNCEERIAVVLTAYFRLLQERGILTDYSGHPGFVVFNDR